MDYECQHGMAVPCWHPVLLGGEITSPGQLRGANDHDGCGMFNASAVLCRWLLAWRASLVTSAHALYSYIVLWFETSGSRRGTSLCGIKPQLAGQRGM